MIDETGKSTETLVANRAVQFQTELRATTTALVTGERSGLRLGTDDSITPVMGTYELDRLCVETGARFVQMVPCTMSPALRPFDIWCDEEGALRDDVHPNNVATALLGGEVYGRTLYGPVLLLSHDAVQ